MEISQNFVAFSEYMNFTKTIAKNLSCPTALKQAKKETKLETNDDGD